MSRAPPPENDGAEPAFAAPPAGQPEIRCGCGRPTPREAVRREIEWRPMLRVALCTLLALTACHRDDPTTLHPKEGELPPLPPASGTPVGYLVDNASQLNLHDDQIAKLKEIDQSLAAKNDEIETQLRIIEKPADDPPAGQGAPPARHNHAPGAQIKTTDDAAKL